MSNPLVSIIVCCYNRGHYLQQTMESIFAQQYKPVEIVVLDDGSTDNTRELIASYGDKVHYFWQENQGAAGARTTGVRLASGEFIAFQDDDDLMPPDRIVNLYKALRHHPPAVLATGDYAFIDAEGNLTGKRWRPLNIKDEGKSVLIDDGYSALLWNTVPVSPHTSLFRKADGDRISWFDSQFSYACSDKDFFLRLAQLGPIVYVREIVSYYRQGHAAIWSNELLGNYSRLLLYEKHFMAMDADKKELRKRVQYHLLKALQKIALYKSQGVTIDDPFLEDHFNKGLSLLGLKARLAYRWYNLIKLPIRKLIRGRY